MLLLSRREGEAIMFVVPPSTTPTTIKVIIGDINVRRKEVKVLSDAPRSVQIDREEIWKLSQPESK